MLLRRIHPRALIVESLLQWSRQRVASKAAALAMYMIFSLAPMLILLIAIAAVFFGEQAVRVELAERLRDLVGVRGAEVIQIVLASAYESRGGWAAALVSIVVLMFSATSAFNELKQSLDELWEGAPGAHPETAAGRPPPGLIRSLMQARLRAFGLVLILALFLLVSLMVSAALTALHYHYGELWTHASVVAASDTLSRFFSFAIVVALFAVVFKLMPAAQTPWLHVIPGAIVTAGLFLLGKMAIGFYLGHSTIASAYGVAGSVVALLIWIYYSSLIFFFGAVLTRQYAAQMA